MLKLMNLKNYFCKEKINQNSFLLGVIDEEESGKYVEMN